MVFISLSTGKLHKEKRTPKLKNFSTGYVGIFYRNLAGNVDGAVSSDFYSRIAKDLDVSFRGIQKYVLSTSDFSKCMENDINQYVRRNRLTTRALDTN